MEQIHAVSCNRLVRCRMVLFPLYLQCKHTVLLQGGFPFSGEAGPPAHADVLEVSDAFPGLGALHDELPSVPVDFLPGWGDLEAIGESDPSLNLPTSFMPARGRVSRGSDGILSQALPRMRDCVFVIRSAQEHERTRHRTNTSLSSLPSRVERSLSVMTNTSRFRQVARHSRVVCFRIKRRGRHHPLGEGLHLILAPALVH